MKAVGRQSNTSAANRPDPRREHTCRRRWVIFLKTLRRLRLPERIGGNDLERPRQPEIHIANPTAGRTNGAALTTMWWRKPHSRRERVGKGPGRAPKRPRPGSVDHRWRGQSVATTQRPAVVFQMGSWHTRGGPMSVGRLGRVLRCGLRRFLSADPPGRPGVSQACPTPACLW